MTQRNLMTLLCISLLIALALPAQSQPRTGQKQLPASDAEIRATLEKLYAAWSDLDPAKAAPFYAKDADLIFFDVAPMKYNAWAEYAAGVPQAFAAYRSGKFTLNDDLRVHRQGNWAWATATWRAELTKKDGSQEHVEGRYSAVLEKRGGQWLVVHEHMSVPMGATPTPQ
ncbi:MAG TPA: nuclear transport factor 2 family protein [Candidatus Udaeobacter sp.]